MKKYLLIYAAIVVGLTFILGMPFMAGLSRLPANPDRISWIISASSLVTFLIVWPALGVLEFFLIMRAIAACEANGVRRL